MTDDLETHLLVAHLRSIDQMSVEDCFCQSPYYIKAAYRLEQLMAERDKYEAAWMTAEGELADAEADNARLRGLLTEADRRIAWESLGFGNDFADRVQAALTGKEPSHE